MVFSQQYNFLSYSIEDGLSQSTVYCLIQDSRGYIWAGTDGGGVCRFDGTNFKTYNNKQGLAGNVVRTIMEDSKRRIWFGTDEGISIYDGLTFRNISNEDGLSGSTVLAIHEDNYGNYWAGTDDGGLNRIYLVSKDSVVIHCYNVDDDKLSSNSIFDLHEDDNKQLWVATLYGGLMIIKISDHASGSGKEQLEIKTLREGRDIPSDLILTIEEDYKGKMWFGTYDVGVFNISNSDADQNVESESEQRSVSKMKGTTIWDIEIDKNGGVWFGTSENGVNRLYNSKFTTYNLDNGLPNNQILSIIEDKEGNLWLGTNGNGLCRFSGERFVHFSEKDGLSSDIIMGIDQDTMGNMWLASDGGGIMKLEMIDDVAKTTVYSTKDGLVSDFTSSIAAGNKFNGSVWIGTSSQGFSQFNGEKFTNYSEDDGLVNNRVNCLHVDSRGIVWTGTAGGISKYDGSKFLSASMERLVIDEDGVLTILSDKNGDMWFGTAGGLAKYNGEGSLYIFDEEEGLLQTNVNTLTIGPKEDIWIGTNGGGIFKFNLNTEDSIPIEFIVDDQRLSSNTINSLIFQDDFTLVVGTDRGFDEVSFNGSYKIISVRNFNSTDGFVGVECNDNSICKDNDGNIWFGTVKGATRYNPNLEGDGLKQPLTHITGLKLFFKEVNWSTKVDSIAPWFNMPENLELSYQENRLTFYFSGISLVNPQKVQYKFILEGWEDDWSLPTTETNAEYSRLDHGGYTFKVMAANASGVWNSEPATFSFVINPPWYKTTIFYVGCVLTFIVSFITFIKAREQKLKAEKKILEDKVEERTVQLKRKSEDLEEALKDIKDSINYASRIQEAILPTNDEMLRLFPQSFILFKPKDVVSGDFYWMSEVENKVFLTVADCTGHGVPGALMSMICSSLLSQSVNEKRISKPDEIFSEVRKGIIKALKQKGEIGGRKEGMDAALCIIDTKGGQIEYVGANNSLYIVRKNGTPFVNGVGEKKDPVLEDNGKKLYELKADRQPVGYHTADQHPFTGQQYKLEKEDTLYMLTDGYQDQFGGTRGKKFMIRRLKQMFLDIQEKGIDEQKKILEETINKWMVDTEQIDDITLIGIKV